MRLLQAASERTKKKERRTGCVGADLNDFWVGNDAPNRSRGGCGVFPVRVAVGNQKRAKRTEGV
jgi:hypothetical protein